MKVPTISIYQWRTVNVLMCWTYTYIFRLFHLWNGQKHPPHILSFSSALIFCKLITLCLFCSVCPDGEASCSHNAVVIPPAHGALAPVNTRPIVSWTSSYPGPAVPPCPWPAELHRLHTVQVNLPEILCTGQGKPCVVMIWWCTICQCFCGMSTGLAVLRGTQVKKMLTMD